MPHALIHLAPFATLLTVIYIALSVNVVLHRRRLGAAMNPDEPLLRAIRAHGNFGEYVPFALLLLLMMCLLNASALLVALLAALLVVSRLSHLYSLLVAEPKYTRYRWRRRGMLGTFAVMLIAGLFLLWQWLQLYL